MDPKVGLNGVTACLGTGDDQIGAKNIESDGPTSQGKGLLVRECEFSTPLTSQEPPFSPLSSGRSLMLYIFLSLVHPPSTLVSHPCPYLSTHPIGYSFWSSVSCCGPHRIIQGSRPHKWGQGVSCGYLIRRWQLLLGLLFYHTPTAGQLDSESPLGSSRGLPLATQRPPPSMTLVCRGQGHPR